MKVKAASAAVVTAMDDTSARADLHNRNIAGTLSTACCSRHAAITLV
jgi:hypothetical protein